VKVSDAEINELAAQHNIHCVLDIDEMADPFQIVRFGLIHGYYNKKKPDVFKKYLLEAQKEI